MKKEYVQKRITLNDDATLPLDCFSWDGQNRVFSSRWDGLVIDFSDVDNCTVKVGDNCIIKVVTTVKFMQVQMHNYCRTPL